MNIGFGWLDEVLAGNLRGAEFDIAQYYNNGSSTEAGYVTSNVVLWPKVYVLSHQPTHLRRPHRRTTRAGSARPPSRRARPRSRRPTTRPPWPVNCVTRGPGSSPPAPSSSTPCTPRWQPVIDGLAADPNNADLLADIQALAADYPDTDMPDVPESCQQRDSADTSASTIPAPSDSSAAPTGNDSTEFPDGVYQTEFALDDMLDRGVDPGQASGLAGLQRDDLRQRYVEA